MTTRSIFRIVRWTLVFVWLAVMARQTTKPLPPGTDIASPSIAMQEQQLDFLYDLTTRDAYGRQLVEQQIFDAVRAIIDNAQTFIVLDYFLFNDDMGDAHATMRPLSREIADHLLARKRAVPKLQVVLITDPINDVYGGRPSPLLDELSRAGIDVVRTDLNVLRDSNPAYSALWRMAAQWFGNSPGGVMPDPFREQGQVSVRSWLALLNFKANHRKVIVADDAKGEWIGIIASANPHGASSLHSNVAWRFRGELAAVAIQSELQVARFSGWTGQLDDARVPRPSNQTSAPNTLVASYVSEQAVRETLLAAMQSTSAGDEICLAMFYLSDRSVIDALLNAANRGVKVRLILDPNKDAFGIEKDGVPNRPVANELVTKSQGKIELRWYRTQGEQFHTKLALIKHGPQLSASLGSANLTRRNVGNYNLETNVQVAIPVDTRLAKKLTGYFDLLWNNDEQKHIEYTASFAAYKDDSQLIYWRYRFMEATGIGTF